MLCSQIPHLRPAEYKRSRLARNRRTVNRAYGGVLSGSAVRERFVLLLDVCICCISLYDFLKYICIYVIGSFVPFWWKSKRLLRRCWKFRKLRKSKQEGVKIWKVSEFRATFLGYSLFWAIINDGKVFRFSILDLYFVFAVMNYTFTTLSTNLSCYSLISGAFNWCFHFQWCLLG